MAFEEKRVRGEREKMNRDSSRQQSKQRVLGGAKAGGKKKRGKQKKGFRKNSNWFIKTAQSEAVVGKTNEDFIG